MDLTEGTEKEKQDRSKKMMLYFGIASLLMSFAGWTSAFIVSRKQRLEEDWLTNYELPSAFTWSLIVILTSSVVLYFAKRALKNNQLQLSATLLLLTFALGVAFIVVQFMGFGQIIDQGYYFTGDSSNITMTYIYLLAAVHIAHVVVGLICLLVVLVKSFAKKYSPSNTTGFDLAATFWHFVDGLWVFLFLFLLFFK